MNLFLKVIATIFIVASFVFVGGWILCLAGFGGGIFFLILIIIPIVLAWFSLRMLWKKKDSVKQSGDIYFLHNNDNNENIQLISYIINAQNSGMDEQKIIENLITVGGWDKDEVLNILDEIKK